MAKTYCYLANQPCTELSFSGDTALSDFFTAVELVRDDHTRQSTLTVPGPAVDAMLRGKKLIVNEINMFPQDLLTVFAQAMDTGRAVLSGTERGNVEVEVHPDFGIIATANPNYVGTVELGRAMERRFGRGLGVIEMDYLPPDEEADAIGHDSRANRSSPGTASLSRSTCASRLLASRRIPERPARRGHDAVADLDTDPGQLDRHGQIHRPSVNYRVCPSLSRNGARGGSGARATPGDGSARHRLPGFSCDRPLGR